MADIDIVPKHRSRLWIWIVIAIVIIVALWLAFGSNRAANRTGALESGATRLVMGTVVLPAANL